MILSSTGIVSNNGKVFFAIIEPVLSISELFKLGSISVRKVRHWISLDSLHCLQHLAVGAVGHSILPEASSTESIELRSCQMEDLDWISVEGKCWGWEWICSIRSNLSHYVGFPPQARRTDLLTQWPLGDCALFFTSLFHSCVSLCFFDQCLEIQHFVSHII